MTWRCCSSNSGGGSARPCSSSRRRHTASDAGIRTCAQRAFVYAIVRHHSSAINTRVSPQTLREITDPSGGRTDGAHTADELQASTARIADELSHQYLLGYVSPKGADGKYHSIRVRVKGTEYKVRARRGYVALPRAGG